jgi:Ser-tRNA(Ala) deacylase AlaX
MGSEKLFLESIEAGYLTNFTAQVTIAEEDKVVLDRTLFYPLGGGQNWDIGTLDGPNGKLQVSEVRGRDDIYHHLEKGHQLEVGDELTDMSTCVCTQPNTWLVELYMIILMKQEQ